MLGWSQANVRTAIAQGERIAAVRLVAALAGNTLPAASEEGPVLDQPDAHRNTATPRRDTGTGPGNDRDKGTPHPCGPGRPTGTPGRPPGADRDRAAVHPSGPGRPPAGDQDVPTRGPGAPIAVW